MVNLVLKLGVVNIWKLLTLVVIYYLVRPLQSREDTKVNKDENITRTG